MNKILWIFLLLSFCIAQAQLVPKGMVLPKNPETADTSLSNTSVPPADSLASMNYVELPKDSSLNWNADKSALADSVAIYQKDYSYNKEKEDHFRKIANISLLSGVAVAVAGICIMTVGLKAENSFEPNVWTYSGTGMIIAGLAAGKVLSFSFNTASDTYMIRANFFKQKKIDYQRRHSVLEP